MKRFFRKFSVWLFRKSFGLSNNIINKERRLSSDGSIKSIK